MHHSIDQDFLDHFIREITQIDREKLDKIKNLFGFQNKHNKSFIDPSRHSFCPKIFLNKNGKLFSNSEPISSK